MQSDKQFYEIFEVNPQWLFELTGRKSPGLQVRVDYAEGDRTAQRRAVATGLSHSANHHC